MRSNLLESVQVVPIVMPSDLTGGASTGDRVRLNMYRRCLFLLLGAAGGTAGEDIIVTLQEHDAPTAGNSQNLATIDRVFSKQAATDLTAVGAFSEVVQAAAATFTDADSAEQAELWGIEVSADQLSEGFEFVSVNLNDVGAGNAKLACVIAILYEPRYGGKASAMPSAIA